MAISWRCCLKSFNLLCVLHERRVIWYLWACTPERGCRCVIEGRKYLASMFSWGLSVWIYALCLMFACQPTSPFDYKCQYHRIDARHWSIDRAVWKHEPRPCVNWAIRRREICPCIDRAIQRREPHPCIGQSWTRDSFLHWLSNQQKVCIVNRHKPRPCIDGTVYRDKIRLRIDKAVDRLIDVGLVLKLAW